MCLLKLFNFKIEVNEEGDHDYETVEPERNKAVSDFNEKLGKFGLYSFQHRFVNKIFNFTHNLINEKDSPELLRNIVINRDKVITRELRNGKIMTDLPVSRSACATFEFFFPRFLNHFSFINFSLDLSSFKYYVNLKKRKRKKL